jgi:hypothetical protein
MVLLPIGARMSMRETKAIAFLGGFLALASLMFGWWFSYWAGNPAGSYDAVMNPTILLLKNPALLIYNISPVYQAGSPGIQLNQTTLGMHLEQTNFIITSAIALVAIGGVLGIMDGAFGKKKGILGLFGGVLAFLGAFAFIAILSIRAGTGILSGDSLAMNASWGLGIGYYMAVVGAALMILSRLVERD